MSKPIKLREIAQCATDLLSQSEDADARTQALRVLALLALVREATSLLIDQRGGRPQCGECHGYLDVKRNDHAAWCQTAKWLARVRDEEA